MATIIYFSLVCAVLLVPAGIAEFVRYFWVW